MSTSPAYGNFERALFEVEAWQIAAERNLARRQISVFDEWLRVFSERGYIDPLWCIEQQHWWIAQPASVGFDRDREG